MAGSVREAPGKIAHFYNTIHGFFDFHGIYRDAVRRASGPATFVEVGTWFGRSAAFMAVEIANSGKPIAFHCVDTWKGSDDVPSMQEILTRCDGFEVFKANMERGGVWSQVTPMRMDSLEAAKAFRDDSVDFCFVDANHAYDAVTADLAAWLPKMRHGGVLAGHDYAQEFMGVKHAVQDFFGAGRFEVIGRSWLHRVEK